MFWIVTHARIRRNRDNGEFRFRLHPETRTDFGLELLQNRIRRISLILAPIPTKVKVEHQSTGTSPK